MNKNLFYISIVLFFSILGMGALFHPGLFTAHDIYHQVVRLHYYHLAISDGQFPPLWIGQLAKGFGYPLFVFSFPLPWIIGDMLLRIGLDMSNTLKGLFFLSYATSGFSMYFFVNSLLRNRLAGLLSSILYLWLPYHFLIIFVGASMGIAFIFTFLPLLLLGIHLSFKENNFGSFITALGLSGIIFSHLMHIIFLLPLIIIFIIWEIIYCQKNLQTAIKKLLLGIILGLMIASFYLIPAAFYNQFTRVHQETGFSEVYKRNFVNFNQLIYSKWGYGPIINNAKNGENSFQLGITQWLSIITLFILIVLKKLSKTYWSLSIAMLLAFIITVFLMLDFSKPIWVVLTKFATVDFPYRLLLPASFIASVCAGIILAKNTKKVQGLIFIPLIFIALYTNRNHINVNLYTNLPLSNYLETVTEITTNTYNEYLPIKANSKLLGKPWREVFGKDMHAFNTKQTTKSLRFDLNATKGTVVSVGQFFFPGQTLYLDNKLYPFNTDANGLISFFAPQGQHIVTVTYEETLLIRISKYLTILGTLILLFLLFIGVREQRKPEFV